MWSESILFQDPLSYQFLMHLAYKIPSLSVNHSLLVELRFDFAYRTRHDTLHGAVVYSSGEPRVGYRRTIGPLLRKAR